MNRRQLLASTIALSTAATAGCLGTARETARGVADDIPVIGPNKIDASVDELQLSVDQFDEAGWELLSDSGSGGDSPGDELEAVNNSSATDDGTESSVRYFLNHETEDLVLTGVVQFSDPDGCKQAYSDLHDEHSGQYSLEEPEIAAEAHVYLAEIGSLSFREKNVLGIVAYEPSSGSPETEYVVEIGELMHENW